jgi:predicted NACHT family NTPase
LKPSPFERVINLLDKFEKGEMEAWWILNLEMTLEPDNTHYMGHLEYESDLRTLPVWKIADADTKERIIRAASTYLTSVKEIETKEWLGENNLYRPAYAGFRALRLLLNEALTRLNSLSSDVWEVWAPITIGYQHSGASIEDSEDQRKLIEFAYHYAPQHIIDTLLVLIDQQNKELRSIPVLKRVQGCWDERLAEALLTKMSDEKLTPISMGEILDELLRHNVAEATSCSYRSSHKPNSITTTHVRRSSSRPVYLAVPSVSALRGCASKRCALSNYKRRDTALA